MLAPRKRSYSYGSISHSSPVKRTRGRPQKSISSAPAITGLEGILSLDKRFVEASQKTSDSERSHNESPNLQEVLAERRLLAKSISGDLTWLEKSRPSGMTNHTGAVCYRHSLFQAVLHMPQFVNWLMEFHQPQDCVSGYGDLCITCNLRRIATTYWGCSSGSLSNLLVSVHRSFHTRGWSTHNESGHGDPDDQLGWIWNEIRGEVPISTRARFDAFSNLTLSSSIICKQCRHTSTTEGNEERHLALPIKPELPTSRIESYLARYMMEVVEDYRCGNPECRDTSRKHRIQRITHAPEILIIQLKRFDWEGRKVNTFVRIDEVLNLNKHRVNPSVGNLEYQLKAVVEHTGSLSFGHYHCIARRSQDRWYDFNDDSVSAVKLDNAIPPIRRKGGYGWTPYLLFYQRLPQ